MRRTLLDVSGFCVGRGRLQLKKSCVRISCRQPYRAPPSETIFGEIQRQTGCQARSPPRSSKSGIHGRKLWPADPSRHNRRSSKSLPPEPAEDACNEKDRHRAVAPDRTEPGEKNDKNRSKKGGTEEPAASQQ